MTREEAIEILEKHHMWTGEPQKLIEVRKENEALAMAISALSENKGDLISRQAVLNTLDNMDKALDEDRTVETYKALLTECIKVLPPAENKEELTNEKAIAFLQDNGWLVEHDRIMTSGIKNNGEWIPVSERLPEKNVKNYLACCEDGYVATIMYGNGRWLINGNNVIAWMPLPEPYKAEKPETCKGCLEPCIMYEPDMRACNKKVREVSE